MENAVSYGLERRTLVSIWMLNLYMEWLLLISDVRLLGTLEYLARDCTYWWCRGTDRPCWPLLLGMDGLALSQEIFGILSWWITTNYRWVMDTVGLKQSCILLCSSSYHHSSWDILKLSLDTSAKKVVGYSIELIARDIERGISNGIILITKLILLSSFFNQERR